MKDLSLHILDIVQNSITAKASLIEIEILEDLKQNIFQIGIIDNGKGMDKETLQKAIDPFYTSRTTRKVGLGLSLFKQNAERTGGIFTIESEQGIGTKVCAKFIHDNIDRPVLGDIVGVISILINSNPEIDFIYRHFYDKNHFIVDTREIKSEIEGIPINTPEIMRFIKEFIQQNLNEIHVVE